MSFCEWARKKIGEFSTRNETTMIVSSIFTRSHRIFNRTLRISNWFYHRLEEDSILSHTHRLSVAASGCVVQTLYIFAESVFVSRSSFYPLGHVSLCIIWQMANEIIWFKHHEVIFDNFAEYSKTFVLECRKSWNFVLLLPWHSCCCLSTSTSQSSQIPFLSIVCCCMKINIRKWKSENLFNFHLFSRYPVYILLAESHRNLRPKICRNIKISQSHSQHTKFCVRFIWLNPIND